MAKRKLKAHTIPGHHVASSLAARAEDLLKANDDVYGEIYDRLDAMEREASFQQAGSKEAALFQLGVLSRVGVKLEADVSEEERDRLAAMHTRLVRSLATYIETITGADRHQCGLTFYFGHDERPMTGFLATLTPEQKAKALGRRRDGVLDELSDGQLASMAAYDGPISVGRIEFGMAEYLNQFDRSPY